MNLIFLSPLLTKAPFFLSSKFGDDKTGLFLYPKPLFFKYLQASVFLILALFSACRTTESTQSQQVTTKTIVDELGRSIEIPVDVQRAVSLAPNLTEIVFAIGAGERLVGVTQNCNFPEGALRIPKIGDTINPNLESIIALQPQVVFVTTASQNENFARQLDQQEIKYIVSDPKSISNVYRSIRLIGETLNKQADSEAAVAQIENRIEVVKQKLAGVEPIRVFVQIDQDSLYTIGRDSFLTEVVSIAGGKSVTEDIATAYPKISKETALLLEPDVIIIPDNGEGARPNAVFHQSPAVVKGRVYRIDADILSRPGPRIADAIEKIAKAIHPEEFR